MYPVLSSTITATSTLFIGTTSRVRFTLNFLFSLFLKMVSVNLEPSSPLSLENKLSLGSLRPYNWVLSAYKIRSPDFIPAFSDGPPGMGFITATESLYI